MKNFTINFHNPADYKDWTTFDSELKNAIEVASGLIEADNNVDLFEALIFSGFTAGDLSNHVLDADIFRLNDNLFRPHPIFSQLSTENQIKLVQLFAWSFGQHDHLASSRKVQNSVVTEQQAPNVDRLSPLPGNRFEALVDEIKEDRSPFTKMTDELIWSSVMCYHIQRIQDECNRDIACLQEEIRKYDQNGPYPLLTQFFWNSAEHYIEIDDQNCDQQPYSGP